jgi:hypothetical protein
VKKREVSDPARIVTVRQAALCYVDGDKSTVCVEYMYNQYTDIGVCVDCSHITLISKIRVKHADRSLCVKTAN